MIMRYCLEATCKNFSVTKFSLGKIICRKNFRPRRAWAKKAKIFSRRKFPAIRQCEIFILRASNARLNGTCTLYHLLQKSHFSFVSHVCDIHVHVRDIHVHVHVPTCTCKSFTQCHVILCSIIENTIFNLVYIHVSIDVQFTINLLYMELTSYRQYRHWSWPDSP